MVRINDIYYNLKTTRLFSSRNELIFKPDSVEIATLGFLICRFSPIATSRKFQGFFCHTNTKSPTTRVGHRKIKMLLKRLWKNKSVNERTFNVFFGIGGIMAGLSSLLYLVIPGFTVQYFNGDPTSTAVFWARIVASADILLSFVYLKAVWSFSAEVKSLAAWASSIYGIVHFGAFIYGNFAIQSHPIPMIIFEFGGLSGSLFCTFC